MVLSSTVKFSQKGSGFGFGVLQSTGALEDAFMPTTQCEEVYAARRSRKRVAAKDLKSKSSEY